MSLISLAAIPLYASIAMLCLRAARWGEQRFWYAAVAVLALMAAMRLADFEDGARNWLRGLLRTSDAYLDRDMLQWPILTLVALSGLAICAVMWRQWRFLPRSSSRRILVLARLALLGFVLIYAVRIVSLHAVDQVLYAGPVRPNYLVELALCGLLGTSAWLFARRRKARQSRTTPSA